MSDLQTRLAHLINYSSQLVFVACDAIADQQKYSTQFLSQHGENAEVSFISAEESMSAVDYRRTICRQLFNQQVGSFVRPLFDEMPTIDEGTNTFILCITKADILPNDFLLELWKWVARTRASKGSFHLNVLLFGSTSWTDKAQKWLPEQDNESPVLLSSQSVDAVGFDVNALESLMEQRRAFFSSKGLFSDDNGGESFIRKKWFIASVMATFLVVFTVLVTWQYPNEIKSLLASGESPIANAYAKEPLPQAQHQEESLVDPGVENLNKSIPDEQPIDDADTDIAEENASSSLTDQLLAGKWQSQESKETSDIEESETIDSQLDNENSEQISANTQADSTENAQESSEKDFMVPDIISVEQLDRTLGNTLLPENETLYAQTNELETTPETLAEPEVVDDEPQSPAQNSAEVPTLSKVATVEDFDTSSIDDYRFDESLLLQLPNDQLVLQISGIKDKQVLETYIESNNLESVTWIYQTERYGGPWYVVLYNDTFDSVDSALAAVNALPERVRDSGAFAKNIEQIRNEIMSQ